MKKHASIKNVKLLSPIWIIPLLTLLVTIWICFDIYNTRGFEITLYTDNANGIIENKTTIKNKDVDIGIVKTISFTDDFTKVLIKARIKKDAFPIINDNSVFWLVTPTISKDGVSGLSTLVSGSYIELISNNKQNNEHKFEKRSFELLNDKPISLEETEGSAFYLQAEKDAKSLNKGDQIIYQGKDVGYINDFSFDENGNKIYKVFINAPYNKLIKNNTFFWVNSGVDFNLSTKGVSFNLSSIEQIVSPVIEFDLLAIEPNKLNKQSNNEKITTFKLYQDKKQADKNIYKNSKQFVLFFDKDINGLSLDSMVYYRGMIIGQILELPYKKLLEEKLTLNSRIPILISIEPERITGIGKDNTFFLQSLIDAQRQGLRVSIDTPNLLTGNSNLKLDYFPNLLTKKIITKRYGDLDELLTTNQDSSVMSNFAKLSDSTSLFINKLNKLPLNNTLNQLNKTLASYQTDSAFQNNLNNSLTKFNKAISELTPLLQTLNKKSNALIFAPKEEKDPIPQKYKSK